MNRNSLVSLCLLLFAVLAACGPSDAPQVATAALPPVSALTDGESASDRDPDWSPDGRWIVYTSDRAGKNSLWKMPAAGGEPVQITSGPGEYYPEWSPDGTRIAFTSHRGGSGNVWTVPAEGGEWTKVTADGDSTSTGAAGGTILGWSPDGESIAFTARRGGDSDIFVVPADGGPARPLVVGAGNADFPDWSPDGEWIVYNATDPDAGSWRDIYVIAADGGGQPRQLTTDPAADMAASWSPDGRWIVFQSNRSGEPGLWLVPSAGGTPAAVTSPDYRAHVAHWSPDGTHIVFNRRPLDQGLAILPAAGGEPILLGAVARGGGGDWSPDGERIAFLGQTDAGNELFTIPATGGEPEQLTHGAEIVDFFHDFDWSADGRTFVYASMASGKRELWSVSADGTDRNQVSAMEGLVSEPALSPDGRRIVHCAQTGSNWDIWITPATGGLGVRLNDWPSEEFGPRWSPDGERIAFVSDRRPATGDSTANYHVYTMPAEGGEATWVTGGASVDWSPDGRSLVVVQRWGNGRGLHVVPASGGTPTPLHDDPASGWLRWSPDGSEILLSPLDVHGAIWVADVSALVGR